MRILHARVGGGGVQERRWSSFFILKKRRERDNPSARTNPALLARSFHRSHDGDRQRQTERESKGGGGRAGERERAGDRCQSDIRAEVLGVAATPRCYFSLASYVVTEIQTMMMIEYDMYTDN